MKGQELQQETRGACYGKRDGREGAVEGIETASDLGSEGLWLHLCPSYTSTPHQCKVWDAPVFSGCGFHLSHSNCSWVTRNGMCKTQYRMAEWEKELDIMCNAEVVGTCTTLLERDIFCVLWEQQQELEHHICYLSCSMEFFLSV